MSLYLMAPTFRGVVVVEETAAVVVGVMKVDAVATAAIVVEESKAAWVHCRACYSRGGMGQGLQPGRRRMRK
ncbi:hypothetical protein S245_052568 [Arachis hypogaea]